MTAVRLIRMNNYKHSRLFVTVHILPGESFEELRKRMLKSAAEGIRDAYSSEEYALINAINAYLDTSKSYNLTNERLSEWWGIYFPDVEIGSPQALVSISMLLGGTGEPDFAAVLDALKDNAKAKQVYERIREPTGRKLNEEERAALLGFAQLGKSMGDSLSTLDKYINAASHRLLPNTTHLTDEKIAAELLSKAGSMERLATMPASTIQLLGAEKALFKHIKFGSKPPKYGVLFKMPQVNSAPKGTRGRIARVYATKISIALKADYYTKKFIADKLKADLDAAVEKIHNAPPREQPQRREGQQQRPYRRPFGRPGGQGRHQGRGRPGYSGPQRHAGFAPESP